MAIKVTDSAKSEVLELMKDSGYKNPALRISLNGFG
jgi:Fe-S cluster assembly iron-binding protein IscA